MGDGGCEGVDGGWGLCGGRWGMGGGGEGVDGGWGL